MARTNSWETARPSWLGPLFGPQTKKLLPDDPEFVAKVSGAIGPRYADAIDTTKANAVTDRMFAGLAGVYMMPRASDETLRRKSNNYQMDIKRDNVYVFPDNQDKTTWAHEFRHRGGAYDEDTNRLLDAYYADSPSVWAAAKEAWLDARSSYYPKMTQALANASLIQWLLDQDYFAGETGAAVQYQKEKGIGAKKFWKGMFDNQYSTAYDKTVSPWKIWAQKEGYLDEKLKPTKALKAMFKSLDKFYENTDKGNK